MANALEEANLSWAYCGEDDEGRPIGYAALATCDKEGCEEEINRDLAFVCGEMHGASDISCGRYFCYAHLCALVDYNAPQLCAKCADRFEDGA